MLKYSEIKNLAEDEKNLPLLNKIAARFGISDFKNHISQIEGFTLAEMLVVMLIASIFIAATMPIITKRTKTLSEPILDEIWKYTTNHADIYYEDKVNIGTKAIHNAQLFVNSEGTESNPQIGLTVSDLSNSAYLRYGLTDRFILGSGNADAKANGGIVIGTNAVAYSENAVAIGKGAQVNTNSMAGDIANLKNQIEVKVTSERTEHNLPIYLHYHLGYYTVTVYRLAVVGYEYFVAYYYWGYTTSYSYYVDYFYGQGHSSTYTYMTWLPVYAVRPVYDWVVDYYHQAYGGFYVLTYDYYRNPTAQGLHHINARCPASVTVTNKATGISKAIYLAEGDTPFTMSGVGVHTGHGNTHTYVSSRALYTYDLLGRTHSNGDTIYGGQCWAGLRVPGTSNGYASSTFHNFLVAAIDEVNEQSIAAFSALSGIAIGNNAIASNAGSVAIGYGASSSVRSQIVLGGSGSTLKVGGNTVSTSDIRLKNIKGLYNRGIKELRKLRTYLFSFKDDETNSMRTGLIAQDVQKVMPEAIAYSDDKGHLAIKSEFITFAMFNAILDLDDSLRAVVKRQFVLERKVAKQEARIKKLEKMVDELSKK